MLSMIWINKFFSNWHTSCHPTSKQSLFLILSLSSSAAEGCEEKASSYMTVSIRFATKKKYVINFFFSSYFLAQVQHRAVASHPQWFTACSWQASFNFSFWKSTIKSLCNKWKNTFNIRSTIWIYSISTTTDWWLLLPKVRLTFSVSDRPVLVLSMNSPKYFK